jgi:hypothetical protein
VGGVPFLPSPPDLNAAYGSLIDQPPAAKIITRNLVEIRKASRNKLENMPVAGRKIFDAPPPRIELKIRKRTI